jgi:hypothetical protein
MCSDNQCLLVLTLALAFDLDDMFNQNPTTLTWKISMPKVYITLQTPTPTKKSFKHLMKSKKLVVKTKATKNLLMALTAISPPFHLASKFVKIVMHKKMTWRTTYFLPTMTKAAPSQRVTPIILLILDLLALPTIAPQLENRSAIVCLHPFKIPVDGISDSFIRTRISLLIL